ncbi:MAG TPA: helix-turn-helix domain-containing protein [Solirubrobacterales bacterium]|nr:helix-turn-helix domain-containing protein [Solirubrobacterales bacterium]
MSRREYGQACSLASALDTIGERWSLLIVRELLLGPLRFSDLARSVGGAPTDVLTRRLRDLENDGVVRRRKLGPPMAARVYELTDVGRELEQPLLELGRWGLNFYRPEDADGVEPSWLPNALRIILRPPPEATLVVQLHSEGHMAFLRIEGGAIAAERGEAADPELVLSGRPREVLAALVVGDADEDAIEIEGSHEALTQLREMVDLPAPLRAEALARVVGVAVSPA